MLISWPIRIAVAAALLVVVAVGAWWFLIREDNALADDPLAFRNTPTVEATVDQATATASAGEKTPAAAATAPATDVSPGEGYELFVIVPEHPSVDGKTEAAYFADEELANLGVPSTAKGTTFDVTGQFSLSPDGLDPAVPTTIVVGLATLTSDESRRDNRVRDALQVGQFPTATFVADRIEGWPGAIADGETVTATLIGTMDLHGVQRELTWEVEAVRQGDILTALATTNFLYEDFDIPVLNIGGFVSVEEDVTIQVQLIAELAP